MWLWAASTGASGFSRAPVVYCCFEGQSGISARVEVRSAAPSPCTGTGYTTTGIAGLRRARVVSTSRSAAAASEVTTPMRPGMGGKARLCFLFEQALGAEALLDAQEALVERPEAGEAHAFDGELEASTGARRASAGHAPRLAGLRAAPSRAPRRGCGT